MGSEMWRATATAVQTRVSDRLTALAPDSGSDARVRVEVLGGRDEYLVSGDEDWSGAVPVHLIGHGAIVGPVTGCPRCLARRWQAARPAEFRDALELGGATHPAGEPLVLTAFATDHLAAIAAALSTDPAGGEDATYPSVHAVDLDGLAVRRHRLVADPECPACAPPTQPCESGDPAQHVELAVVELRPAPKLAHDLFRTRDLLAYELPVDAFANPVCGAVGPGVVTDLCSVTTAATAGGFTTRSGSYLRTTHWGGHADSYAHSTRIGILEGLERYAGIRARSDRTGTATATTAALDDLVDLGVTALDPRECGLYTDDFYEAHPEIDRFDPARPIRWVRGYSLRDHRPVRVPEVLAHYQTPVKQRRFVQSTSSGCATGACVEEAVLHGLLEAVERDAFLIAWYAGLRLPELDIGTSRRASTRQMVDRLAMYGYDARFFDTRIDLRIPVVTAVAVRRDGGLGALCVGGGSSPDPEAAAAAALCEIATDAVNLRRRTAEDEARLRSMSSDFDQVAELHDHPLAYGIPEMAVHAERLLAGSAPVRSLAAAYPDAPPLHDDLRDDLVWCLGEVTGRGFDVVVVDQTLPEQRRLGLVTVNVIVPGLVPIDFGWDRQRALHMDRVRTAPREAGLCDRALTESDLHRVPHPFP
ncbi:TOMM precursor leader peptide-binding protein [Nocardioides insulae]|uniref:TOMM precursor leader peptide-binding protein n=1 Tax=Nocardioides insulae TaxID=394734 RepID=UPI000405FFED|nr:TOMM precursor leader peptide-binding protein [Nocardioides insulae]